MFATLHGGLPLPPTEPDGASDQDGPAVVSMAVAAQADAGLDPVTDGDLALGDPFRVVPLGLAGIAEDSHGRFTIAALPAWEAPIMVEAWRLTDRAAASAGGQPRAAKARLPGPYSLARVLETASHRIEDLELSLAEALNAEIRALEAAGCPLVQIDEPDLARVGDDAAARGRFVEAQRRLLEGTHIHALLAVVGGSADEAGAATVFDAPFSSVLVDLITGPDNWRLVRQAPGDRGIVCAAMPVEVDRTIDLPLLVWAAQYAAASNARGPARVGLATAGSLASLSWDEADRRMRLLGEAAAIAAESPAALATKLDPRAIARPRRTLGPAVPTPPLDSRGRPPRDPTRRRDAGRADQVEDGDEAGVDDPGA